MNFIPVLSVNIYTTDKVLGVPLNKVTYLDLICVEKSFLGTPLEGKERHMFK